MFLDTEVDYHRGIRSILPEYINLGDYTTFVPGVNEI